MRFASILLHAQDLVSKTNPLGATTLLREGGAEAVVEAVRPIIDKVDGILLQRFHGALDGPVVVGVRPDRMEVETYVGSPEDRRLDAEEIRTWAGLASETRLGIYTTMPRSLAGFAELDRLSEIHPWGVFFDVAGQNKSLLAHRALSRVEGFRGVPEPTPFPELTPSWMRPDQYTAGMAERWRTLRRRRAMPTIGMVMFNGNRAGKSHWNPAEAAEWEKLGLDVSGPANRMFPELQLVD